MIMIIQMDKITAFNKFNSYEIEFKNENDVNVSVFLDNDIVEFENVIGLKVYQSGNLIDKFIFVDERELEKELVKKTKINEGE